MKIALRLFPLLRYLVNQGEHINLYLPHTSKHDAEHAVNRTVPQASTIQTEQTSKGKVDQLWLTLVHLKFHRSQSTILFKPHISV